VRGCAVPTAAEAREKLAADLYRVYCFAKELSIDPEYGDEDDPPIWALAMDVVASNDPEPGEGPVRGQSP
jgi:hypothetical protein